MILPDVFKLLAGGSSAFSGLSDTQTGPVSREYWNNVLNKCGLPANLIPVDTQLQQAGFEPVSFEVEEAQILHLQDVAARAVEHENMYSSSMPIGRISGLPICKWTKLIGQ